MALLPKGHALRRGHFALDRSTPVDRERAACENGLGAARALLWYIEATLGDGRARVPRAERLAAREDSSLEIIVAPSEVSLVSREKRLSSLKESGVRWFRDVVHSW